jgi:hypothetical protein
VETRKRTKTLPKARASQITAEKKDYRGLIDHLGQESEYKISRTTAQKEQQK